MAMKRKLGPSYIAVLGLVRYSFSQLQPPSFCLLRSTLEPPKLCPPGRCARWGLGGSPCTSSKRNPLYTEDFLDGDVMVVDKLDQLKAVFEQMERALEYIGPDELLEITPESIRLRKLVKELAKR